MLKRLVINSSLSNWKEESSGALQRSILASMLFHIFIDYLEERLKSTNSNFADDRKLGGIADSFGEMGFVFKVEE